MKKVLTTDNSFTLYNEAVNEHYHSLTGAKEEAEEKYANALKVWEKESPIIYDVCFGLGYNAAAAIDIIRFHKNDSKITIFCFENDEVVLNEILNINAPFESYNLIKRFIKGFLEQKKTELEENNVKLVMLFGDAKELITLPEKDANFVFFDPFSPKKMPDMWSKQIFDDLYSKMKTGATLATYSCARSPRDNMRAAGFEVIDGPVVRRWSPGTICIKH